jgi:hypothetical protein
MQAQHCHTLPEHAVRHVCEADIVLSLPSRLLSINHMRKVAVQHITDMRLPSLINGQV